MKICHYGSNYIGAVKDNKIFAFGEELIDRGYLRHGFSMTELINSLSAMGTLDNKTLQGSIESSHYVLLDETTLHAPINNPSAIWAAAENYASHVLEMMGAEGVLTSKNHDKNAIMSGFFLKPPSSIIGPGDTIVLPKHVEWVDFECELCAVIGKTARNVTQADALDYIFGYTILWDISQRRPDWGKQSRCIRKGYDTFTPVGPWIVTSDEIHDPQDLSIKVVLNDELVMDASTKDMICTVCDQVNFLSNFVTLRPGDLIATGTPAGVRKISPGDRLKGSIECIGEMELLVQ